VLERDVPTAKTAADRRPRNAAEPNAILKPVAGRERETDHEAYSREDSHAECDPSRDADFRRTLASAEASEPNAESLPDLCGTCNAIGADERKERGDRVRDRREVHAKQDCNAQLLCRRFYEFVQDVECARFLHRLVLYKL